MVSLTDPPVPVPALICHSEAPFIKGWICFPLLTSGMALRCALMKWNRAQLLCEQAQVGLQRPLEANQPLAHTDAETSPLQNRIDQLSPTPNQQCVVSNHLSLGLVLYIAKPSWCRSSVRGNVIQRRQCGAWSALSQGPCYERWYSRVVVTLFRPGPRVLFFTMCREISYSCPGARPVCR